eukprot:TRINITY_DN2451_c0_g1_i1.p1 TRINITY_DN2451_c0_g1~~TRINITY_DN2451_c0_g1_i1.p1  ORF type:complete len:1200 (-),score=384.00 TRINITY_DN2451_c0_g1_i1:251-3826(-)
MSDYFYLLTTNWEKFNETLTKHVRQQPYVIDREISKCVVYLCEKILDEKDFLLEMQHCYSLYTLIDVRGLKVVRKFIPHSNELFEIMTQKVQEYSTKFENRMEYDDIKQEMIWKSLCVFQYWLSILLLIPFDLNTVDSGLFETSVIEYIFLNSLTFLKSPSKVKDGAGIVLARLLTRLDSMQKYLPRFLTFCYDVLNTKNIIDVTGVINTICWIIEYGQREEIAVYFNSFVSLLDLITCQSTDESEIFFHKVVLAEKIGLLLLPEQIAQWRYQRGRRGLTGHSNAVNIDFEMELQQFQVVDGELLEDILGICLNALSDRSSAVRWNAASAVGRLTQRLPLFLADEVVEFVLSLFSPLMLDHSWHGACIALAELARRGLFLPDRVPTALTVVHQALKYEYRRGKRVIGDDVRDAAAYVIWSFARAYDSSLLRDYVPSIAANLACRAVFDTEINVRRAAAAAFQEFVGRQDNVPHGIEILQLADFYSVGKISHCFVEIAPTIAKWPEYTATFAMNLLTTRVFHWNDEIQGLAAQCLNKLVYDHPKMMKDLMFDIICDKVMGVNERVGGISALIVFLKAYVDLDDFKKDFSEDEKKFLVDLPLTFSKQRLFVCPKSTLLRKVMCEYIEALVQCKFKLKVKNVVVYFEIVEISLKKPFDWVRFSACNALSVLAESFKKEALKLVKKLIENFQKDLLSFDENRASAGSLAVIPLFLLEQWRDVEVIDLNSIKNENDDVFEEEYNIVYDVNKNIVDIIDLLSSKAYYDSTSQFQDVEIRVASISAIVSIIGRVFLEKGADSDLLKILMQKANNVLINGLKDYETTKQGDVGSIVRICVLEHIPIFVKMWKLSQDTEISMDLWENILLQRYSRLMRVRRIAHSSIVHLKYGGFDLENIPSMGYHPIMQMYAPLPLHDFNVDIVNIHEMSNWTSEEASNYFAFLPLLKENDYGFFIFKGLVSCVGGNIESEAKSSKEAIRQFYRDKIGFDANVWLNWCVQIFDDLTNSIVPKNIYIYPLIYTLGWLNQNQILNETFDNYEVWNQIIQKIKLIQRKTKDVNNIRNIVEFFCSLISNEDGSNIYFKLSIGSLLNCLQHSFPLVRTFTCQQMYQAFNTMIIIENDIYNPFFDDFDKLQEYFQPIIDKDPSFLNIISLNKDDFILSHPILILLTFIEGCDQIEIIKLCVSLLASLVGIQKRSK